MVMRHSHEKRATQGSLRRAVVWLLLIRTYVWLHAVPTCSRHTGGMAGAVPPVLRALRSV